MYSEAGSTTTSHALHGTFISEKVGKIRWKPERFEEPHFFLTGSVDNEINRIVLWDFFDNVEEDDIYPFLVSEQPYCGDVTEIKFLNTDYFVCSSSSGSAHLKKLTVSENSGALSIQDYTIWENLHYFQNGDTSSCTGLALYENDLVTIGEDGRINLLACQTKNVIRTLENADSCSLQCVAFLKHNEVITSNLRGQMKIWDLRSDSNKPSVTFTLSGDQITATCLTFYPTQRHIILAGDESGALTSWDLRQNTFPVNVMNAHEGAISEIQFHPDDPNHLFTCSSAGEVWHWSTKNRSKYSFALDTEEINIWLAPESVKSKMEVLTLMPTLGKPINSLDLNRNKVICGCDNEAIYLVNGVNL